MSVFGPHLIERLRVLLAERRPVPWNDAGRRPAAVLIPLFVSGGRVHVVLTKKTAHLRRHSGQISFPGGGWDPEDGSLETTALREAEEEVGIRPSDVELLGTLDDMPTATTGYVIRPYVGVIPHPYAFVPDGFEVERVLTPPLELFSDPARLREETWERSGWSVPMRFYDVGEGDVVWGATARVIALLMAFVEGREPPPPPPLGI